MATLTRRPPAPPPPRPNSAVDPLAYTGTEWREAERQKAARRRVWVVRAAVALTLPFLAGGLYAFPLVYGWRALCARWPQARLYGAAWALPGALALYQWCDAVLAPTLGLARAALAEGASLPVSWVLPLTLPYGLGAVELGLADPLPVLWGTLAGAWLPGLVGASVLAAAWGVGGFLEGARLHTHTPGGVAREARRAVRLSGGALDVVRGLVRRGYVTKLYSPEGGGKTEATLAMIRASMRGEAWPQGEGGRETREARWYYLTEQTHQTFWPYLEAWGLTDAVTRGRLRIVTRSDANKLWEAHGHRTEATWEELAPIVHDDAGRWGADVFVQDTWTDWSGAKDNKTIRCHMAPIREAVVRWGYAYLSLGHANEKGDLLGGKEFRRLCEVTVKMTMPRGKYDPLRVFHFDKDRTRGTVPAFAAVRDIEADPPCFRAVPVPEDGPDDGRTPAGLTGKGVSHRPGPSGAGGGIPIRSTAPLREVEPEWVRVRALLPATAPQLTERTGWSRWTMHARLKRWEAQKRIVYQKPAPGERAGTWRLAGDRDGRLRRTG